MTVLFAYDYMKIEPPKIISENRRFLKVEAVITKAGVYKYDNGMALKPSKELLKATRTARYAKLTLDTHPDTKVIMSQKQLFGGVEKPFFDSGTAKMRAVLSFDKLFCSADALNQVRSGNLRDVSIGFYYMQDFTPGWAPDVNTGRLTHYDYVMRDIVIDHVVAAVRPGERGRCTFPNCGIGVDTIFERVAILDASLEIGEDKVVKRGDRWCVIHCHGEKAGQAIACFATKEKAEAMHRAIQARQHAGSLIHGNVPEMKECEKAYIEIFGDVAADQRPPKAGWEKCYSDAQSFATDPAKFCGWLFHHGHEKPNFAKLKAHYFGSATIKTKGDKKGLAQEDETAYESCLTEKKAEGMSNEEAEKACEALKPKAADQEGEKTPWQLCIQKHMAEGLDKEQARMKCKEEGVAQDQETEEPAPPQETLPTPLEECIASRMESQGEPEEAAKAWCEDELAGLHKPTEQIVDSIDKLRQKEEKLNRG